MAKRTPTRAKTRARAAAPKSLPVEIDAAGNGPLGMPPAIFLRDYWQKRPLLIRNAFPGYVSPVTPEDLAGLACEDGALARIARYDRASDAWSVRTGPFAEEEFPGMPHHDWTLLVQDVDKWDPEIRALLDAFDFLPRWRMDDIMISFAAPGGSVGAHIDQYDVFLLQGLGHRRWMIDTAPNPDQTYLDNVPLRLLKHFVPTHDWVLAPGDMLYIPPGLPHHGVAEDACMTISVGLRAPSSAELLGDFVDTLICDADEAVRYADPDLAPAKDPCEIDAAAMGRAIEALNKLRMHDPERLGDWFGRFISLYRSAGMPLDPDPPRSRIEVEFDLQQGAVLARHPWTRAAWRRDGADKRRARLYIGGQVHDLALADARTLAAAETLDADVYAGLGEDARTVVLDLLAQGHYHLALPDDGNDDDA